jgi:hypothetical protein
MPYLCHREAGTLLTLNTSKQMTLQAQALTAGYAVVDMGKAGMQIQGFRFLVKRLSDNAIYHFATAKQVREQLAA